MKLISVQSRGNRLAKCHDEWETGKWRLSLKEFCTIKKKYVQIGVEWFRTKRGLLGAAETWLKGASQ